MTLLEWLALLFALGGTITGAWYAYHGITAGLRDKRITHGMSRRVDVGRRAVVTGFVFVLVGVLVLLPCTIALVVLARRAMDSLGQ
jgi:hypothetical protein